VRLHAGGANFGESSDPIAWNMIDSAVLPQSHLPCENDNASAGAANPNTTLLYHPKKRAQTTQHHFCLKKGGAHT